MAPYWCCASSHVIDATEYNRRFLALFDSLRGHVACRHRSFSRRACTCVNVDACFWARKSPIPTGRFGSGAASAAIGQEQAFTNGSFRAAQFRCPNIVWIHVPQIIKFDANPCPVERIDYLISSRGFVLEHDEPDRSRARVVCQGYAGFLSFSSSESNKSI